MSDDTDDTDDALAGFAPLAGAAAADSLITRVREFSSTLTSAERSLFALLLAPGIAQAYPSVGIDEVEGFGLVDWSPGALPNHLVQAVRTGGLRVEFTS